MFAGIVTIALLLPIAGSAAAPSVAANEGPGAPAASSLQAATASKRARFSLGVAGSVYSERSEPGLEGTTIAGAVSFTGRVTERISVIVEGGRARFFGDHQAGHRDFFLSGLVGVHATPGPSGVVVLVGPTLLHSQLHSHFADLDTNRLALSVGLDYVWLVGARVAIAATWRSDFSSGISVHRPGAAVRVRF